MITAAVIDPLILLRLRILMDVSNAMECTQGFLIPITHMILCHICHHMPFGVLVFDLIYMLNVIGSNKRCIVKYVRFLPFWLQQEMRPVPTCLHLPFFRNSGCTLRTLRSFSQHSQWEPKILRLVFYYIQGVSWIFPAQNSSQLKVSNSVKYCVLRSTCSDRLS